MIVLNIRFEDVLILLATGILAAFILIKTGVFGGDRAARKAVADKKRMESQQKNRNFGYWLLGQFEAFANNVGGGISSTMQYKYDFYIVRLDMKAPFVDRPWKPIEIVGLHRMIALLGVVLTGIGISSLSFNPLWFAILLCFVSRIREMIWESRVLAEDTELEEDFPDLFLILNPKLKMGANARIATTLDEYNVTLDRLYTQGEHMAIRKFVRLLRNLIETYSTEVDAIAKVRTYYKAASVVNFCNVAIQAMNGVDNKEKLIAFEQELTNKKLALMRKRAEKLVEKAQKATYLMYVILAEFVIITLYTRMGGNLDALFAMF